MPWLLHDQLARVLVIGSVVVFVAVEAGATLAGGVRPSAPSQDRGTRLILGLGGWAGLFAALMIARHAPGLRAGADSWWTLGLGVALVLTGAALRGWAIVTLGRHFRRVVTIEPDQRLIRRGPYRVLRHPSYTGLLLAWGGLGLALGSWVGAAVATVGMLIGLLPRIRVEERALRSNFGSEYEEYEHATWRLVPHVW